ncbi:DUF4124 domain-containing protein [Thiothrix litoralis]|jgi:hypothetical protein|uniref:DUF4124 domain-containing protein n=1 Tax=Thiothrix litoralis TaxID=2891210 RepID=A0ABX7WYH7_9GAMM|nr:DUF4124 domain-containing protein [Thiothrix litoralis]QTR47348.1 DUF4124 domain-containing protein [Thiothrix litoralis]
MNKAILMPAVLLAMTLNAPSVSAEMYKWTDKRGETHYTQTPPPPDAKGKDIEDDIRLSTGKLGNILPEQASKATGKDDMEQARQAGEKSDKKHRDFCAQQEAALKQMTANALIKWKDSEGERFLTAEEKISKMKEMQNNIDSMCKPEMFSSKDGTPTSQTEKANDARHSTEEGKTVERSATSTQKGKDSGTITSGSGTTSASSMLPATN